MEPKIMESSLYGSDKEALEVLKALIEKRDAYWKNPGTRRNTRLRMQELRQVRDAAYEWLLLNAGGDWHRGSMHIGRHGFGPAICFQLNGAPYLDRV